MVDSDSETDVYCSSDGQSDFEGFCEVVLRPARAQNHPGPLLAVQLQLVTVLVSTSVHLTLTHYVYIPK